MKSLVMRAVVMLFFALIVKGLTERIDINDYLSLITDIHKYYRTSCVIFVHRSNDPDLNITTIMHTWLHEFSRRRVMTMTVTFLNLMAKNNEYRNIMRPLFVTLLDTKESINEFANATRNGVYLESTTFPLWLVLFFQLSEHSLSLCRHPTDNIFNVNFHTKMLVLCYDQPILTEWYAISDNRTRTFELATWTADRGLILKTQKSLYARRSDLFGETLRVASVYESPFFFLENGTAAGFLGALMLELSETMNFKMQLLNPVKSYGSWKQEKGIWTGVIGQLVTDQTDIGVGEFSITPHRRDVVDFTLPLMHSRNRLYIRQPDSSRVHWLGYLKAFDFKIWLMVLIIIICSPILLAIIKAKGCISMNLIMENYMHVWSIFCQQGLSEFPNESPIRLAFFSIFILSLLIQAAYSASVISFLTLPTFTLPFSTIDGYIMDGSYKLIVVKDSVDHDMFNYAEKPILMKMNNLMKEEQQLPFLSVKAFKQVCEEEKVAFYTTEVLNNVIEVQCKMVFIEAGKIDSMAIILQKDSPYFGIINYHIRRFLDNGVMSRLKEKYLLKTNSPEVQLNKVCLQRIMPILMILAGGMVLGIFILILEKAYYVFKIRHKSGFVKKPSNEFHIKLQRRNTPKDLHLQSLYNMYYGRPISYWP